MTEREYNEANGVRRSDLWRMNDSPEKYKYFLDNPPESTPALVFGSACHKMILEPGDFGNEYAIAPNVDGRTKEGKEIKARFAEENAGKTILSQDDADTMTGMEQKLEECSLARDLLRGDGETEVPFFWTDPETGEDCKVKLDRLITGLDGRLYVVDYKTAASADTEKFNKSMFSYGYTLQAAMYTEGVFCNTFESRKFAFVAQEKAPPYAVRVYFCDPGFVDDGMATFRELIGIYHKCRASGEWPGYRDGVLYGE